MSKADYYILSHYPSVLRSEHANVGLLWRDQEGRWGVELLPTLEKLRTLDPSVKVENLRAWTKGLKDFFLTDTFDKALRFFQESSSWGIADKPGMFVYDTPDQFQQRLNFALNLLMPPLPLKEDKVAEPRSLLFQDLKKQFELSNWIGKDQEDIKEHRIIPRYRLSKDINIKADFALQNGSLNVIETLDLRVLNVSKKQREAMSKALVLDFAKKVDGNAKTFAVVATDETNRQTDSIEVLRAYSNNVTFWEDIDGMERLFIHLEDALKRPRLRLQ